MEKIYHTPVLLKEIVEFLEIRPDSILVDVTCGEGGHSEAFLELIPKGRLVCIDRNAEILKRAQERLSRFSNVSFHRVTFDRIGEVLAQEKISSADGILADLGVSMFHFRAAENESMGLGFSYTDTSSLDMRLDDFTDLTAEKVASG